MRRPPDRSSRNPSSKSLAQRPRALPSRSFRPLPIRLEERTLLSTVNWIQPGGGDWDTPSNWSTGALPGPSDHAVIDVPGITVTHSSSMSDSVNSLTISSSDSTLDMSSGSLALATTSSIAGSLTLSGATLSTAADLTVSGSMSWTGGTIAGFGSLDIANGATLQVSLDPGVTATLDGVVLENAGAAALALAAGCCGFGLALVDGAGIDNLATGTFTFPTDLPYDTTAEITGDGSGTFFDNEGSLIQPEDNIGETAIGVPFRNSGSVAVQQGSLDLESVTNSGAISVESGASLGVASDTQTAGSTILVGGTIYGGSLTINGGSLAGTGTIDGSVTSAGQVMPGGAGAAGVLTINGSYTQTAAGALDIDIGGTAAGTQYDQLDVSGPATADGALVPDLIGGFTPTQGQTFTVVNASPLSGTFLPIDQSAITGAVGFQPNDSGTSLGLVAAKSSTTTLTSSVNPSSFSQSGTFMATVTATPPNTGTPIGTVTFYDGSTSLGTATLGGGKATLRTTGLAIGSHAISVVYAGGGTFATGASSTLTQVVNADATTTSLTSSAYGQSVALTATGSVVAPGTGTPTESISFYNGSNLLATVALSGKTATYKSGALAVGLHSITAVDSGDANNFGSTSPALDQAVNQDGTTATVTSSKEPSAYGQSVTFTATVKAASPGSGTPTGTAEFLDGSAVLATVALSGGKATYSTPALAVGSHSITVAYGGDGNFLASTSSALAQTVEQDATTAKVSSSANPSVYGQTVTFTATVAAGSPGGGTPTGTVTFMDGSSAIGVGTLSVVSGVDEATFATSGLAGASHSITAVYGGDPNFTASTSSALTQTVKHASTTTTLVSSANPWTLGQSLTFKATVAPVAPGAGIPTSTVTFYDGSTAIGTGTVSGGVATFTTSTLSVGTHSIKAVYAGDTNFKTSTSAVVKQIVQNASTIAGVGAVGGPQTRDRRYVLWSPDDRHEPRPRRGAGRPPG